uniref:RRM domain-containing protein n=1 Tax=Timema tahoe TaxID=61484 RepID=A0A7R9FI38_9NEOP|nr:unnamed protein product [Timema tahoe]
MQYTKETWSRRLCRSDQNVSHRPRAAPLPHKIDESRVELKRLFADVMAIVILRPPTPQDVSFAHARTGRHPEVGSVGARDPRNSFGSPMPALMYKEKRLQVRPKKRWESQITECASERRRMVEGGESLRGPSVPPYAAAPPDRYEEGYQNGPGPGSFPDHFAERYPAMDRYSSTAGSEGLDQRYGSMKPEYGREPLHPTPPRPGYGPSALSQSQGGPGAPVPQQRSVMMVYGLDFDKVNADKLFNVFCLYGNIAKIKFLRTKEGCAMVQMGDSLSVERCLQNLNDVPLFDSTLQLGYSKQAFLSDSLNPWSLPDETPSFKDFINSRNNRFVNPAMASKNRIQPPSKILHFFNTPPNLTDEMLNKVFEEHNVTPPKTIKLFPLKSEYPPTFDLVPFHIPLEMFKINMFYLAQSTHLIPWITPNLGRYETLICADRSSSGLMEFEDVGQALEGLMMCNHVPIQNPGGFPYMMKLCFSSARSMATRERNNQKQQEMQEDE